MTETTMRHHATSQRRHEIQVSQFPFAPYLRLSTVGKVPFGEDAFADLPLRRRVVA
jgi:hypothetical protein